MSETKRNYFTCNFKAKVAIEAVRGLKTSNQIGQDFAPPTQVTLWKKELTDQASSLFDVKRGAIPVDALLMALWKRRPGKGLIWHTVEAVNTLRIVTVIIQKT